LLGTKLRALYQRSKGRDLFDLDFARQHHKLNYDEIVHCFKEYIQFSTNKRPPSKKEFLINLKEKEMILILQEIWKLYCVLISNTIKKQLLSG